MSRLSIPIDMLNIYKLVMFLNRGTYPEKNISKLKEQRLNFQKLNSQLEEKLEMNFILTPNSIYHVPR